MNKQDLIKRILFSISLTMSIIVIVFTLGLITMIIIGTTKLLLFEIGLEKEISGLTTIIITATALFLIGIAIGPEESN